MSWHDLIREARERAELSQAELAEKVGCSQATINKIENERPQSSRYLMEIIHQLGLSNADFPDSAFGGAQVLTSGERMVRRQSLGKNEKSKASKEVPSTWAANLKLGGEVPLYTPTNLVDEMYVIENALAGTVQRPPFLQGVIGAYALSIDDDSMVPECEPGDILFVNPHLIITPECLCAFYCCGDEGYAGEIYGETFLEIKRFIGQTDSAWKTLQHNPQKEQELGKGMWSVRHRIVAKIFR